MDQEQERKLLKEAFEAFKSGNDGELRDKVKTLVCASEAATYDLACMFKLHMESPGNKFSSEERFYGECVLGQLYLIAKDEISERDFVLRVLAKAQDHFDQAYVRWESLPGRDVDAGEKIKKGYLVAERNINTVNMFFNH
jgi:hypothetical protein